MERKKYLIVTAGGTGTRMGSALPKQFLKLGGVPVLRMSIERFLAAFPDIKVIVTLPEAHIGWWKAYCIENAFTCPQTIVPGGITRFHSIRNALAYVPDGAVVAVHDAVRPLITPACISRLFSLSVGAGSFDWVPAVVPVIPCIDTMKVLKKDGSGKLVAVPGASADRSLLYAAQTPQIFYSETLKAAYGQPFDTAFTDDASVVAKLNTPILYAEGERHNIKLTTRDDMTLAEAILSLGSRPH